LLVATWYAARASSRMEGQAPTADLERLAHEVASNQQKLDEEIEKRRQLKTQLDSAGPAALAQAKKTEDALSKAEALIEQQKTEIARREQTKNVLEALAHSGARLLPMKATEAAGKGIGYAVLAEKWRLVFVGSNVPKPADEHTFQLWILRKESPTEPSTVSAGVFMPADNGSCVEIFENAALLSNVTGVLVTEEPLDGKYDKPSGPKLFEASAAEEN